MADPASDVSDPLSREQLAPPRPAPDTLPIPVWDCTAARCRDLGASGYRLVGVTDVDRLAIWRRENPLGIVDVPAAAASPGRER